ncbi:unnamed protein product, partial [Mesorhabditis belari]|uniref:Uncharacterized protein n=1 Tax=Mesorhabditis belari TaxID=2138241 RepID=A0AAF3E9L0_9BILA
MASDQESLSLPHIIRNRELSDGESPLSDDEDSEENETLRITRKDPLEFSPKPLGDEVQDAHTLRPTDEFEYIPFPSLRPQPTPPTQDRKRIYTSPRDSKIEKNPRPIPPPKPKYLKESRLLKSPTADCRPMSRDSGISICTNPQCPYSTGQHILRISILPDSKDEIYEVHSPAQTGDSGIEHTRATPSTSTDFSPRSDLKSEYASPRPPSKAATPESVNQLLIQRETPPPDHAPPPPPSTLSTDERLYSEEQRQKARDTLDQVLIPIAVERERSRGTIESNQGSDEEEKIPIDQHFIEEETFPDPPPHISSQELKEAVITQHAKFSCLSEREESARVEATLHLAPTKISQSISRTFPSLQAIPSERPSEKSVLVELTVELNREQNALISTHKYPQKVKGERAIVSTKVQNGVRKTTSQSNMVPPPVPLYRAVDIPFDDSSKDTYQPPIRNEKSSKDGYFTVILEMGSQPVHKGFGMGIHSERGEPLKVESVLVGTPADRAGLQVGDRIASINGEDVVDAYPSAINRMLHEAARLGEVELRILRLATTHYENVARLQKSASAASFDKTRSIFQGAPLAKTPEQRKREAFGSINSGTLRQDSAVSRNSQSSISSTTSEHRGLQRSSTGTSFDPYRAPEIKMIQTPQIESGFRKSYGVEGDFRVTTASTKQGPGKLSDFVPEVERDSQNILYQGLDDESRKSEDDSIPRTIRNYDLRPTPAISQSFALRRDSDDASVCAVLKRSTLPRNAGGKALEDASETDGDFNDGKDSLAEGAVRVSVEPRSRRASGSTMMAPRGAPLRSSSQDSLLTTTEEVYRRYEYRRYTPTYADPRDYDQRADHSPRTRVIPVIRDPRPPSREDNYYPRIETMPVYRSTSIRDDYPAPEEPPTIASGRMTPIAIERRYRNESPEVGRDESGSVRSRARSTDARGSTSRPIYIQRKQYNNYYDPDYDEIDNDGVSRASHRFYDKDGRALRREERREERVVEVTRSYENLEEDPREWRQVIKSQRQAAPGQPQDNQRIRDASQSLGNLPTYMNRRMKEQEEKEREERKYLDSARMDVQEDFRQRNIEKNRERQDSRNYRESNDRQPRVVKDWREQERTYNGGPAPDGYSSLHRSYGNERSNDQGRVDPRYGTIPDKPQRHPAQPYQRDFDKQEPVVAVSGKHRCGHCGNELGRGQAMIIESLSLYYHLSCFRCIVCGTALGNGTTGADVRVRDGKLHCYSCYSNDAVQLSKV